MASKPMSDLEYNAKWIARITAKCTSNAQGCILWRGTLTYNGYGQDAYRGKTRSLHRQMYKVVKCVELTSRQYVCHHCDNRNCVNVEHLWLGTAKENQQDMSRKGRAGFQSRPHCHAGHEMTPENTVRWSPLFRRTCRMCHLIRSRMKAGWSKEEAESTPIVPVGTPTKRRYIGAKRANAR